MVNYPEKLEVYIREDNSENKLLIQVTDDCQARYDKPASKADNFGSFGSIQPQKRSVDGNQRTVKCYELSSVAFSLEPFLSSLELPFLSFNEQSLQFDDSFSGNELEIRLIGHYQATQSFHRWYTINELSIYGRLV